MCALFLATVLSASATDQFPFRDATLPVEERVGDLLARMALKEKVAQLNQSMIGRNDNPNNVETQKQKFNPLTGSYIYFQADVEKRNEYQRRAVEETRLGIPIVFAYDVIHGFRTVYPISLGQACSWNPGLVEQACRMAAEEASSSGLDWTFSPMVDVAHDPRWGRVSEGYGEDPYANAVFGAASVRGYQGGDLSKPGTIAACLKHFVGYSESEGGRDYSYTDISNRALWEWYLPPFKAGVDAGAATIMSSFNDINGVPAVCNEFYLNEVLRNRWKFDGAVVSDWNAILQLKNQGFSKDRKVQAKASLEAGNDIDMMSKAYNRIPDLVKEGRLSMDTVDEAVRRVLRLKFRLGLFERPYTEVRTDSERFLKPEYLRIAEELAAESIVLLKNESNTLPFGEKVKSIALVGNMLDDREALLGSWSAHGNTNDVVSIKEGLEQVLPAETRLIENPEEADVILLCLGEQKKMSGENASRSTIQLPGAERLGKYAAYTKPIVLVVSSGRPVSLEKLEPQVDAILHIWQPGVRGSVALARILAGQVNPSGKLAMTFPRHVGQIPIYYNMHTRARRGRQGAYQDLDMSPMYPFGHGLSYTQFKYSKLKVNTKTLEAKVKVSNTGKRAGKEAVLWFISDPEARITQPIKKLKHFEKVELEPGKSKEVVFQIDPEKDLSYPDFEGNQILEPGTFILHVGDQSDEFTLKGKTR